MIPELRRRFNAGFTREKYVDMLRRAQVASGPIHFRQCETPLFIERSLVAKMVEYGAELIHQSVANPKSAEAVPDKYNVPGEPDHPMFVQVDFGLTADLQPKLVEIQAFPSLYGFQPVVAQAYREAYGLDGSPQSLLIEDYWDLLAKAIVGNWAPHEVALVEIDPYYQKTVADFLITARRLGIRIVDIREIRRFGRKLFGPDGPIERIYNRAIADELDRRGVELQFDLREPVEVEWAGHPNWYFRISKFSIPFLNHPSVPRTQFLDQVSRIPDDLERWVLKPLYSFAGLGVSVGPTRKQVEQVSDPSQWILQERIDFAPLVETPHGPTQAEIRIMYIWLEQLQAVTTIVRMGRGKMMGVDHNRGMEWVGGSVAFWPE